MYIEFLIIKLINNIYLNLILFKFNNKRSWNLILDKLRLISFRRKFTINLQLFIGTDNRKY